MTSGRRPGAQAPRAPVRARGPAASPAWAPSALVAVAVALCVAGVTVALVRAHGFVWDDLDLVVRDPAVASGDYFRLWTGDFGRAAGGHTGFWRPLVLASFAVDWAVGGGSPFPFHAGNAIAHACAAGLVAWLATRAGASRAWAVLAGFTYAFAAAQSEPAAWIAARTDVFASMFTLAFLALDDAPRRSATGVALSALALALAVASKEAAFVAPLVALARRRAAGRALLEGGAPWAWFGVIAVLGAAHARFADAMPPLAHVDRVALAASLPALFWAQLAVLAPGFPHAPLLEWAPPAPGLSALGAAGLLALAALAVVAWRARHATLPALALLVLPLLPVLAGALLEGRARWADRFVATSAAGLALLLAWAAGRAGAAWRARRAPVPALAMALVVAWPLAQLPAFVSGVAAWRSDETRLRAQVAARPGSLDARLGLADLLASEGRLPEAAAVVDEAERHLPGLAGTAAARADLALRSGDAAGALEQSTEALRRDAGSVAGAVVRASALQRLGRVGEALAAAESLTRAQPGVAPIAALHARLLLAAGRDADALAALRAVARELPGDADVVLSLGVAEARAGRLSEARDAFARVTQLDPGRYDAWLLLAGAEARGGRAAEAVAALDRADALPQAADGRAAAMRRDLAGGAR